jgi:thiosulfate/3-mercaptopyruvate sulfurtransferase
VKKIVLFSLLALTLVAVPLFSVSASAAHFPPPGPAIDPIVSTDWLEGNLGAEDLVVLDVRSEGEYAAGHITGAVNVPIAFPVSAWTAMRDSIFYEVPPAEELFATIGNAGITADSRVVVVGRTCDLPGVPAAYSTADANRVAITLIYAGVENVAILDGGHDKWVADGKTVDTVPVTPTPVTYTGDVDEAMFVSKNYVTWKMRRATVLDGRDPEFYFGIAMEPFYTREGHIPGATCLPAPYFWDATVDGTGATIYMTYKDTAVLKEMASGAVGRHFFFHREIIVYCGVGGYASTLWFVLTEVAGYRNVKIFDGSAQEWTADPTAPVVLYKWE